MTLDPVVLLTDDERGIALTLADGLRARGARPVLVRVGEHLAEVGPGSYAADLADPVGVADLLQCLRRRHGLVAGLIHLVPLKSWPPFETMDLDDWRHRLRLELKSLFYLAKAAGSDLKGAARAGAGWVIAATAMGGNFASDGERGPGSFFPGQGGIAGLVKTLALEWPEVCCKTVDVSPEEPPVVVANLLLGELATRNGQAEVGYAGARRLGIRPGPASLDPNGSSGLAIDSSWVVLVTGGARGITAQAARELAARYRPTLVVVGRTPLPDPEEAPETAGLTTPQALKAAMVDRVRRVGQLVTPAQVEAACARVLREREMRSNLAAMKQAGATVRYCQVDVRDASAFAAAIDEIYHVHTRLDGVIHGAGIIEDKLLEDKTADSFDRVFDTKVDSAFILSRHLRPDSLRFLVFFSSVAGRFGNQGQSDYAAANEVLNKLAIYLDRQWPGRVVAINWGPWATTGMVSAEVQRQFAERGVQLIPPAAGCRVLAEELRSGGKGQVEIILGDGPWRSEASVPSTSVIQDRPLLREQPLRAERRGAVELTYRLDPARDRYLEDHRLDGRPVFPVAMAMELMAQVAQTVWPDGVMIGIRDLQVLRGIILENGPRDIRITARPQPHRTPEGQRLDMELEISEQRQENLPCYRARLHLSPGFPAPPPSEPGGLSGLRPFPMTVEEAYLRWLFHGPCFQGISSIEGVGPQGIIAILNPSTPSACVADPLARQWLIDPVLIDSGFQLAILWERIHHDMTPLPSRIKQYRRFAPPPEGPVRCEVLTQSSAGGHTLIITLRFMDPAGRIISLLEEMELSCSRTLNRLAGSVGLGRGGRG